MSERLWVGTSGWAYSHWRGIFYPRDMPRTQWLAHYAERFCTVELNNSFHRLPSETAFRRWASAAPPGFCYAVKASRYLTHMKKLREPEEPLQRFLERTRLLGDKLGPILYQLPPRWRCNITRLRAFLAYLPRDLVHVLEFRDPSWITEEVLAALREHNTGFCVIAHPQIPSPIVATARTVYVRLHGAKTLDASRYAEDELRRWAWQLQEALADDHEVYVYFNNDAYGYAIENAQRLAELVKGQ
jgi:uncharacterized protein YecE (DUF72 family)